MPIQKEEFARPDASGATLAIYVQPGAKVAGFAGVYDNCLKLKVKAAAQDGKANEAVIEFLANYFAVPKTSVTIVRGLAARRKTVSINGTTESIMKLCREAALVDS